ncbi:cytochrome b-c1 complex subunit 8-like [Ostrinia nubilalis]|uniref:cytochrome b-c1 complex subunit 8-like n=1 Tax=Ostrinia furnacalis TaxID=93504 RepID=UPI00103A04F1|nr:cytochrome b-c1 complex subunit 8-like [Ostrinia furnacalis]
MGKHFGELATIRGIIAYKISPHEQKPFAGAFSYGIPNCFRRFRECVFVVVPPFVVGYLVYKAAEEAHYLSKRKNPRDFMFEEDPEAK